MNSTQTSPYVLQAGSGADLGADAPDRGLSSNLESACKDTLAYKHDRPARSPRCKGGINLGLETVLCSLVLQRTVHIDKQLLIKLQCSSSNAGTLQS